MDRLNNIRLFLFDMDGTLYLGDRIYGFTLELLDAIRRAGKRYLFMTNNSSKSVEAYIHKLRGMGISATEEDFITSSQATARYLMKHHWGQRLYVCGTESLREELRKHGFSLADKPDDTDCIVMGFDSELNFQKLWDISYLLCTRPEIPYIATNPDYVCPTEFGSVPDCGSVCDMLYNVARRRPLVIGKPEPAMPRIAMEQWGARPEETAVFGDRIYTDIRSGLAAGVLSVLVMSGETTWEDLQASDVKPDLVLESAADLLPYI